ncbi:MAG: hypothetical protein QXZ56_06655, partial [Sulfolobales archaeon]
TAFILFISWESALIRKVFWFSFASYIGIFHLGCPPNIPPVKSMLIIVVSGSDIHVDKKRVPSHAIPILRMTLGLMP